MSNQFSEADGRQLAVDMLRELGKHWMIVGERMYGAELAEVDVTETLLNEEPQILRRYLLTVQHKRNAALERGFLCLLSEYLGSAVEGAPLDLDAYDQHVDHHRGCQDAQRRTQ